MKNDVYDEISIDNFVAIDNSRLEFMDWMAFEPNYIGASAASICYNLDCGSAEWNDKSIRDDANVVCAYKVPGKTKILYQFLRT